MTTDVTSTYRLRLGPIASELLDSLPGQNATALDTELQRLREIAEQAVALEEDRQRVIATNRHLAGHVGELATAVSSLSNTVNNQMDLLDHRTREFEKLLLHISGMVGSHMTDGAERDRLHVRLQEIAVDMSKQMEKLSTLVKDQHKARQMLVQNAVGRAEEERLTIVDQERVMIKQAAERGGMER